MSKKVFLEDEIQHLGLQDVNPGIDEKPLPGLFIDANQPVLVGFDHPVRDLKMIFPDAHGGDGLVA